MSKTRKSLDAQQSAKMERRWNRLVKLYTDEINVMIWADKIVQKYLIWEKEKDDNKNF
jgi:hypothetical protein